VFGRVTHPAGSAALIAAAGLALLVADVVAGVPMVLAWIALAFAAGYSISGSV
jgi:hypothetical protein